MFSVPKDKKNKTLQSLFPNTTSWFDYHTSKAFNYEIICTQPVTWTPPEPVSVNIQ